VSGQRKVWRQEGGASDQGGREAGVEGALVVVVLVVLEAGTDVIVPPWTGTGDVSGGCERVGRSVGIRGIWRRRGTQAGGRKDATRGWRGEGNICRGTPDALPIGS
jgi:hypothetical protein